MRKLNNTSKAINHLQKCALTFENARDTCKYESAEYWGNHDKAINLYNTAASLMPGQGWDYCKSNWDRF